MGGLRFMPSRVSGHGGGAEIGELHGDRVAGRREMQPGIGSRGDELAGPHAVHVAQRVDQGDGGAGGGLRRDGRRFADADFVPFTRTVACSCESSVHRHCGRRVPMMKAPLDMQSPARSSSGVWHNPGTARADDLDADDAVPPPPPPRSVFARAGAGRDRTGTQSPPRCRAAASPRPSSRGARPHPRAENDAAHHTLCAHRDFPAATCSPSARTVASWIACAAAMWPAGCRRAVRRCVCRSGAPPPARPPRRVLRGPA